MSKRGRAISKESRDGGRFVALPHVVLESHGWRQAGHVARSLLIDIAQQYTGSNNGRLVACNKYLGPLGWKSHDVVTRALRELAGCGLLIETRKGARPNRAAWFALTWYALDAGTADGLDIDHRLYRRGGYMLPAGRGSQNTGVTPSCGIERKGIAPPDGIGPIPATPSDGAIRAAAVVIPIPSRGECLEKPSGFGVSEAMVRDGR